MRLIDADELIEHAWRDKLDSRELIAEMIETAPTIKEIPTNIPIGGDLISREGTLTAFADYVGSGMSMNDYNALWDIVAKMPPVNQEPKFIAKSDGTIEQIKECDDCLFKKEWEKIGKLLSVVLEKQIEQEPCEDAISREDALLALTGEIKETDTIETIIARIARRIRKLPPVNPTKTGHWKRVSMDRYATHAQYWYKCDKCGELNLGNTDFCPNCGARMVEPQERSGEE